MALTLDQEQALFDLEKTFRNLFITGGAGTGKSYLIQEYLKKQIDAIPVLASTGAAAILVHGRTFHSFFSLGVMQGGLKATLEKAAQNQRLKRRLRKSHLVIIDEISMLSSETLDCAERIARMHLDSTKAWGGLRVIAVGDFAQLPPVTRSREFGLSAPADSAKDWGFLGDAWEASDFKMIHLKEVMRTADQEFSAILQDLRAGKLTSRLKIYLEQQTREYVETDIPHLFPRRVQMEAFNRERLNEIGEKPRVYPTVYAGESHYVTAIKKDAPIPEILELKKGALVMFRVNDPKQKFVNGSLGRVRSLGEDSMSIETNGKEIELEPFSFTTQDADGNEVASAKNFPLNLAYASTIHKIQGATLDKVHIDMAGLWEPGQAYVALSRVRKAKDATIMRWSERSIKADPIVAEFYAKKPQHLIDRDEQRERMGFTIRHD